MIQFDTKAGTHFEGAEIGVSHHAANQAVEDFRIPEPEARDWVTDNLRKAQYIGEIYGDGQKVRLFGFQRIAFIVAKDADVVITVYPRHNVDATLRNPIEQIVQEAVAAATQRMTIAEESAARVIAGIEAGIAKADAAIQGAQFDYVIEQMILWREDLVKMVEAEKQLVEQSRADHARLLKGVVAYV